MEERKCITCGAPLPRRRRKYCDTCAHSAEQIAEEKQRQRRYERDWRRKDRRPDWTEEDWRLWEERKAGRKQAIALRQSRTTLRQDEEWQARQHEWKMKENRVRHRRWKGKIVCYWCEEEIPQETIKRHKRKEPPRFCNRLCLTEWRRYFGFYHRLSAHGNEGQARYKAITGTLPAADKRREAVSKSNREQPKRKRKDEF